MAPATVNNHLAHLSALFSWIAVHAPAGLLRHGDPTKKVDPLRLPAPQVRALAGAQVRTVKNVLDRIEGFHPLNGRRHRGSGTPPVHRHARPLRDRAIVHLILGTGLRRAEVTGLDLAQLDPGNPAGLRRVKKARPPPRRRGHRPRTPTRHAPAARPAPHLRVPALGNLRAQPRRTRAAPRTRQRPLPVPVHQPTRRYRR